MTTDQISDLADKLEAAGAFQDGALVIELVPDDLISQLVPAKVAATVRLIAWARNLMHEVSWRDDVKALPGALHRQWSARARDLWQRGLPRPEAEFAAWAQLYGRPDGAEAH